MLQLENDLAHAGGVAQAVAALSVPVELEDACRLLRRAMGRLRLLIEGGALDGLAEDLLERALRVFEEVSGALEWAQVQRTAPCNTLLRSTDLRM